MTLRKQRISLHVLLLITLTGLHAGLHEHPPVEKHRMVLGTALNHMGEGNGNPLQCSCLENPRDGGAWWAAVCGVTQSWTRLKRLSSSSLNHNQIVQSGLGRHGPCLELTQKGPP